jgi:4-hydroxybenzoate polyprenyltransferase
MGMAGKINALNKYLSLVKFSHTIFALPFAISGYFLATVLYASDFDWFKLLYIILCMVFARNAAMGFNRYADWKIDAKNERTRVREIPAGLISPRNAMLFVGFNSIAFVTSAGMINSLCLYLSPVALLVILGYSLTKRFTWLCHYVLGLGLSLAPVGAFVAVTGYFALEPILMGLIVLFWVSSFDVIYALQDEHFDRKEGLFSLPARFGAERALFIARVGHFICAILLILFISLHIVAYQFPLFPISLAALIFSAALIYQHSLVKSYDLSRVNLAFFTSNGIASVTFAALYIFSLLQFTS